MTSALAMGRRAQILQALAANRLDTAINLIRNSPGLDWKTVVPTEYHDAIQEAL